MSIISLHLLQCTVRGLRIQERLSKINFALLKQDYSGFFQPQRLFTQRSLSTEQKVSQPNRGFNWFEK